MRYTPSYNQIKSYFSEEWILPMIKLRTWDEPTRTYTPFDTGIVVLRNIILKRMARKLFADSVLDHIIEKTGGFLRDLLNVVYDAALNAAARNNFSIEEKDMIVALNKLQSSVCAGFPDSSRVRLERIKNGEKRYAADQELMVLLRSGAVFEYNGKSWVDLHPLVLDWLNETHAWRKHKEAEKHEI
jgi:SpoVK/Ycf46/Vps4 family AAA+-type ATPase